MFSGAKKKLIVKVANATISVLLRTGTVPYESDCRLVCCTDKHSKTPKIYIFLVLNDMIFDISVIYQGLHKKGAEIEKFKDFLRTFFTVRIKDFSRTGHKIQGLFIPCANPEILETTP